MRQLFKWPGFALVVLGIAVFPFAIWFPGPWGVISLVMIMTGCFLLVFARPASSGLGERDEAGDGSSDGIDQDKRVD